MLQLLFSLLDLEDSIQCCAGNMEVIFWFLPFSDSVLTERLICSKYTLHTMNHVKCEYMCMPKVAKSLLLVVKNKL